MGYKGTIAKTNYVLGEISPRLLGRFDADKPIYKNGAAILENMLIFQSGAVMFRPGTQFIAEVKNSANKVRLERFRYSISQEYVMEIGDKYIRFFADKGQVVVSSASAWLTATPYVVGDYVTESSIIYYCIVAHTSGTFATDLAAGKWVAQTALEIPTIFAQAEIFFLQMASKADVMYIVDPNYHPQKLIRTSATSFSISDVPFIRGPFLDDNITATTITPSSATGATTLTASTAIFQSGHVGSLWRVKDGVVKITGFTSTTILTGTVQAEPDGAAGNLGTTSATTDWAEGAFSAVRGYPTAVTFHEQRLVYGGTTYKSQNIYGSVGGAYDNFDKGSAGDNDAYIFEINNPNIVNDIRWLDSDTALKIGGSGGTVSASSGNLGITPANPPTITIDTDYGVMQTQATRLGGYLFYLQASKFNLRQLVFDLIINKDKSNDMNLLADHILRDGQGAVQMARQQSPNDRIWVVRGDGQIAILTRNNEQQVTGWCRIVGGESDFTVTCNGLNGYFETITILPIDGEDDQVWVVCQRRINGTFKRFVEVFTDELFDFDWEPVRMDSSLSYNNPLDITAISNTNPIVVTSASHGFSNGDLVRLDNIIGMEFLNGNVYLIGNVTTNTFSLYQP